MSPKEGQSLNISRSNSRYMSRRFCGTVKKFGLNNLQAELNLSTNIHSLEETSISIPDLRLLRDRFKLSVLQKPDCCLSFYTRTLAGPLALLSVYYSLGGLPL